MKREFGLLYVVLMIMVLSITTIGATYAYWTATTASNNNDIKTESTIYSISMDINPLYHDFSVIPMNDEDALKALKNKCKDKYDRGACSAYNIHVYDYDVNLGFVSGFMNVSTNNMQNLSYMMLKESDTYDEDTCVIIDDTEDIYCVAKEASSVEIDTDLSLGDTYDVVGTESIDFILLMWLSNLNVSQNETDIGTFEAIVTMQAGSGGEIKGSISSALIIDGMVGGEE